MNDDILSLLPKLGTMGSNEGRTKVTGTSTHSITHAPNCYLRTAQIKGVKNYYGLFHDPADTTTTSWLADYNVNIPEILKILDEL